MYASYCPVSKYLLTSLPFIILSTHFFLMKQVRHLHTHTSKIPVTYTFRRGAVRRPFNITVETLFPKKFKMTVIAEIMIQASGNKLGVAYKFLL